MLENSQAGEVDGETSWWSSGLEPRLPVEGVDLIPGHGTRMPYALGAKKQNIRNRNNMVKMSIKLKNDPYQKILKKKKRKKVRGSSGEGGRRSLQHWPTLFHIRDSQLTNSVVKKDSFR